MGKDYHVSLVHPGISPLWRRAAGGCLKSDGTRRRPLHCDCANPYGVGRRYGWLQCRSGATHGTPLATLCAGDADRLPRRLSGRGAVYFHGQLLAIVRARLDGQHDSRYIRSAG